MPGVIKQWVRILDLGATLRDLKERGYTKGTWAWIPQTDKVEVKAWKLRKKR